MEERSGRPSRRKTDTLQAARALVQHQVAPRALVDVRDPPQAHVGAGRRTQRQLGDLGRARARFPSGHGASARRVHHLGLGIARLFRVVVHSPLPGEGAPLGPAPPQPGGGLLGSMAGSWGPVINQLRKDR